MNKYLVEFKSKEFTKSMTIESQDKDTATEWGVIQLQTWHYLAEKFRIIVTEIVK